MDYKKVYDQLVEKAKPRGLDKTKHEGYFEIHHIIPRCMGGGDEESNLVMFTGREHYIAHMLLWKAYPEEVSLMRAAFLMSSRVKSGDFGNETRPIGSRVYEKLRREYAQAVSEQVSGEGNPFYGKTHTEESLEKMRAWHAANPSQTGTSFLGRKHTEESREKMSEAAKAREPNRKGKREPLRARLARYETNKPKGQKSFEGEAHPPWSRGKVKQDPTILQVWYMADFYRDLWLELYCPGAVGFSKDLLYLGYDGIRSSVFRRLLGHFSSGWIPEEDSSWMQFKEEYEQS